MKTKQELKQYFENGDIPVQEEFWEWQDSYWHKDEKLPLQNIDYDFAKKADVNASNLSTQNAQLWKDKIETQTSIQNPELNGNILTVFYTGENSVQQSKSVDLSGLITNDIHIKNAEYNASQNIITITQNDGSAFQINLSEFSIIPTTNADGSVTLTQEDQEKVTLKKVAVSGSYNDLTDKPSFTGSDTLQNVIDRGNTLTKPIVFNPDEGRAAELGFNKTTYSHNWGNINTAHTGAYGLGIGYNTLAKLTTGANNIALGSYALNEVTTGKWNTATGISSGSKLTTGNFNAFFGTQAGTETTTGTGNTYIGDEAGNKNVTGTNNTALGIGAAYALTNGIQNTILGAFSGRNHGKVTSSGAWGSNTFIGYNAASTTHAMGVWGDNNVVIGCNAPLGGSTSNKLVIDSYTTPQRHDFVTPFIYGDFAARTLNFDAVITAKRTPLADSTYSRVAVMNDNNTIGYKNLSDFQNYLPLSGTEPGRPITGDLHLNESVNFINYINASYNSKFALEDGGFGFTGTGGSASDTFVLSISQAMELNFTSSFVDSKGITSDVYFGDNYDDKSFIQKKYADKQHSYTTKEELTGGSWINGKPVYKKTVVFNQIPRTGYIDFKVEFPDIETIISNEMFTEWQAIDATFAGNQWRTKAYITIERRMAKIELINDPDYDYSVIDSFTLTLEYTKK